MDYKSRAEEIINLKKEDFKLRDKLIQNGQIGDGYNEEMEALHNWNADRLNDIIDAIGYPTSDKVGEEASEAAWLVIQHSIGQPFFMKRCVKLLENAVNENRGDPIGLAYLTDRIAVFEGKLQRYGTQFDWDENGELSPNPFDDLAKVNQRRKLVGLNTLEKQVEVMRRQAENENHSRPMNAERMKQDFDEWKRKVGWLK